MMDLPGRPPAQLDLRGRTLDLRSPRVMGILNLTPDSFFPASRVVDVPAVEARALEMLEAGADLLDLGAMSSRPGSDPVTPEEEIERLLPALTAIRRATDVPLSVDTYRPLVAQAAIDAGADLLNDITGLEQSDELARIAARYDAGLVLMHMRGTPRTMQEETHYDDIVGEVTHFLAGAVARARDAGVAGRRIIIDPGIGFGKSVAGNLELLRRLGALATIGQPILVGASRKSFIGKLLDLEVEERLAPSVAAAVVAVVRGAQIVRVHDVRETVQAVRLATLIEQPSAATGAGDASRSLG